MARTPKSIKLKIKVDEPMVAQALEALARQRELLEQAEVELQELSDYRQLLSKLIELHGLEVRLTGSDGTAYIGDPKGCGDATCGALEIPVTARGAELLWKLKSSSA
jgi:hypothetical protein